jgi:hypothetical protein
MLKNILSKIGVIIINANSAIKKRYKKDPKIFFKNGIHYCSPGPTNIPRFLMTYVMQAIASSIYYKGL